jgi:phosphatidylserine synthase
VTFDNLLHISLNHLINTDQGFSGMPKSKNKFILIVNCLNSPAIEGQSWQKILVLLFLIFKTIVGRNIFSSIYFAETFSCKETTAGVTSSQ